MQEYPNLTLVVPMPVNMLRQSKALRKVFKCKRLVAVLTPVVGYDHSGMTIVVSAATLVRVGQHPRGHHECDGQAQPGGYR